MGVKKGVIYNERSPFYRLKSVPISAVKIENGFWKDRMEVSRKNGLPTLLKVLKKHGVVDNFLRLTGKKNVKRKGMHATDSDFYKWIEAVSFILQSFRDLQLKKELDKIVEVVVNAQEKNGYLNTYFVEEYKKERFRKLGWSHELYCAGHLLQASIAHYRATGETKLLDSAIKFANFLCKKFGPGKIEETDGHPEVEMALIELFRETGERKYLELAEFFLKKVNYFKLKEISGHAVRATYYNCGLTDYYAETGDKEVLKSLRTQWKSMLKSKIYITGGVGGRHINESFGKPYELPNEYSYAETCAAIGNIFWNWRMLSLKGEAKFADLTEKILYNGFLSGVSLNGDMYFYVNPLASNGKPEIDPWGGPNCRWMINKPPQRKFWYDCTCCPPNVLRMFASLPGYFYSMSSKGIWIHLYGNNQLNWYLKNGKKLTLTQKTKYPWNGKIKIEIVPEETVEFSIFLRIPNWCQKYEVMVNDKPVEKIALPGNYLRIRKKWERYNSILLNLEMRPILVECNPKVAENRSSVAFQYGPIIYCLEGIDNPGFSALDLAVKTSKSGDMADGLKTRFKKELLGGVVVIEGRGRVPIGGKHLSSLYRPLQTKKERGRKVKFRAIPYYAWANRGVWPMTVWLYSLPKEKSDFITTVPT